MTEEFEMRPDGLVTCKLSQDDVTKLIRMFSKHLVGNYLLRGLGDAELLKLTCPVADLDVYEVRHICKQPRKCTFVPVYFLTLFQDLQPPGFFCRFDQTTLPLRSRATILNYTPDSGVSKFLVILEIFFVIHVVEIILVVVPVDVVYNPLLVSTPEI
jgi:hypothetical protein